MQTCKEEKVDGKPVAWIVGDPETPRKPADVPTYEYAVQAAESLKGAFARWVEAGGKGGEIMYY